MTNYNIRLSMTRSNNFLPDTGLWEELAPDDALIINQERIDKTQKRMDDLLDLAYSYSVKLSYAMSRRWEAAGKDPIDLMYQIKELESRLADCTCEEDE